MIPALQWLRQYSKNRLRADVTAGLTASAVVIPKAMGYAASAGLPLQVGLYTVLVPGICSRSFGPPQPASHS